MVDKPIISFISFGSTSSNMVVTNGAIASLISVEYNDIYSVGASTLEMDFLSSYSSMPALNTFVEIGICYSSSSGNVLRTGIMKVDDITRRYGGATTRIGAIAWNYDTEGFSVGGGITYTNSTVASVVADNTSRMGLTLSPLPNPLPSTIIGTTNVLSASVDNLCVLSTEESRVGLLQEIAEDYGYAFQIKSGILYFRALSNLRALATVMSLTATDIMPGAEFRESLSGTFRRAIATTRSGTIATTTDSTMATTPDLSVEHSKGQYYENLASTALRSNGELARRNFGRYTGRIRCAGHYLLQCPNNIQLVSVGSDSGKYQIVKANHDFSSSGWLTNLELQRVF